MKRSSTAIWYGTGKTGSGKITSQSKVLANTHYAYNTRFEEEKGTNPEELIAAAHAGCFTMKLSFLLNEEGFTADELETRSTVTLEKTGITESHLSVKGKVPGISKEKFLELAERSKNECPVSKALRMKITMDAVLQLPALAD
jgi:osmotically inducible protein OsmC